MISIACSGKPTYRRSLTTKGFPAEWLTLEPLLFSVAMASKPKQTPGSAVEPRDHRTKRDGTGIAAVITAIAAVITAIALLPAGLWAAFTWIAAQSHQTTIENQQRKDAFEAQQRQAQQAHEIALRESQKPFLEKQLAFYFEAAKVTGKLATLDPAVKSAQAGIEDWAWARKRFWELYWGELGVVESLQVASAMVDFGNTLKEIEKCVDAGEICAGRQNALTGASLQLAHSIRESIETGWGYKLPSAPTGLRAVATP
jgi:hypothetical protein